MLLTLADGQGTSAEAWSDWKESLVWHLYHATSQYLADQDSVLSSRRRSNARSIADSGRGASSLPDFAEEIEAHFDFMPDNYFRAFGVDGNRLAPGIVPDFLAKHLPAQTSSASLRRSHGKRFRSRAQHRLDLHLGPAATARQDRRRVLGRSDQYS